MADNLRIWGFEPEDWIRLGQLLFGGRGVQRAGLVAITRGEQLEKLLSTASGTLDKNAEPWPVPLAALASKHRASWAARLETNASNELAERLGAGLARQQDLTEQVLLLMRLLRQLQAEGLLELWPRWLATFPVPEAATVSRALGLLVKPGQSIAIAAFQAGKLHVACAARRGNAGFDLLVGPRVLRREMERMTTGVGREREHLARAIGEVAGPVACVCSAEFDTLRRLLPIAPPGAWTRAIAAREVTFYPVAPALLPVTIDLGRITWATLGQLGTRLAKITGASSRRSPASRWATRHEGD